MIITSIWPSEFYEETQNPETKVIDIRTPEEIKQFWYIEWTELFLNMNATNFPESILALDKNTKYLIYCWHGTRSWFALQFMKNENFSYVKDLIWWIHKWEQDGFKLIKT